MLAVVPFQPFVGQAVFPMRVVIPLLDFMTLRFPVGMAFLLQREEPVEVAVVVVQAYPIGLPKFVMLVVC